MITNLIFEDILITQSLINIYFIYFYLFYFILFYFFLVCLDQHVNQKTTLRGFLNVHRSNFHLSSLGGVVMTFPVIPVDTISPWRVLSVMIQTVQVGDMTAGVPPASFKALSTVSAPAVIILIFGGKGVTTMTRERITSSFWKQNTNI